MRTPAERALDRYNAELERLRNLSRPSDSDTRRMRVLTRHLIPQARRAVQQVRDRERS